MGHKYKSIFYEGLEVLTSGKEYVIGDPTRTMIYYLEDIINRQACGEELPFRDPEFATQLTTVLDFLERKNEVRHREVLKVANSKVRKFQLSNCYTMRKGITHYRSLLAAVAV